MTQQPRVEQRAEQPYVAIPFRVTEDGFPAAVDNGFPELFAWLARHGIEPAGPPFIRYLAIEMGREYEIELGAPVAAGLLGDGRVRADVLPAGRYAMLLHLGSYGGLVDANAGLEKWAEREGIALDSRATERGSVWRSRVEHYVTDPRQEPDASKWETEIAFLTADT